MLTARSLSEPSARLCIGINAVNCPESGVGREVDKTMRITDVPPVALQTNHELSEDV